jgi:zinc/manganese transport system permease protein
VAALSAAVLAVWFGAQRWLGQAGFYLVFAVAVTASVQLVGVYLVFSSLIMPALAVRQAPVRWQLPLAWGSGALAYTVGLCVSAMFDWPSGAVVVVAMALVSTILGGVVACWPHPDPEQV